MKNKKYRVLLHAMTFSRDFSFIYVVSKLLESMGCECIIANNTNIRKPYFKLWNPHAVFFVTFSHAKHLKASYPKAKLFYWAAEGGYEDGTEELFLLNDEQTWEIIDRVYIWGKATKNALERKMNAIGLPESSRNQFTAKCFMAGNPRADIARSQSQSTKREDNKIRIGLIGNFYYINSKNYPPFSIMLDSELSEKGSINQLNAIQFQIRQLKTYCDIIQDLGTEKYKFSLRPYPLENLDNYTPLAHTQKFPFEIDDHLDFSSWLANQDLVIGATSTTIAQIAAMKKPYINIDKLNKRPKRDYEKIMAKALKNHQPTSYPQLLDMIQHYQKHKFDNMEIHKRLEYYHNASEKHSTIFRVAKDICSMLDAASTLNLKSYLTKKHVLFLDKLWSRYIEYRNAEELAEDYSYFNRTTILPRAESELSPAIKGIMANNKDFRDE